MYRSLHPCDMFNEIERLQRELQQSFSSSPSIRGTARGGFPAMNVGGTAGQHPTNRALARRNPESAQER